MVSAHLLYQDFFRFLEALSAGSEDPWVLYQRHYLGKHEAALRAWWDQCLGLPEDSWADRVRRVRPPEYGLLSLLVQQTDLGGVSRDALDRCQAVLPLTPEPEVYLMVGFFSPDGFAFEVSGRWTIGIGLERLASARPVPILIAHEYAHCYRRRFARPRTLGERLVEEGFAVELSSRAFPERPEAEHLLMRPGQVAAIRDYEPALWRAVQAHLESEDETIVARIVYGRASDGWPSRAGPYLGWRLVRAFLGTGAGGFEAPASHLLAWAAETSSLACDEHASAV
jgi:hypothetical protein